MKRKLNTITSTIERQQKVTSNVMFMFAIKLLVIFLFTISCKESFDSVLYTNAGSVTKDFLLKTRNGYLLIDTGYTHHYNEFKIELKKLGIRISDIKYLLLTHHHDDHSGFAQKLIEETGAQLIVHYKAYPYLATGKPELKMKPLNKCTNLAFILFTSFIKKNKDHSFPPIFRRTQYKIIEEDDKHFLQKIGIDGTILHTPGHTDDSISIVLADGKTFVGDTAMNFLNICMCNHRPIYANDINQVYRSWKKLIKYGAKRIYTSHGPSFDAERLSVTMKKFKINKY